MGSLELRRRARLALLAGLVVAGLLAAGNVGAGASARHATKARQHPAGLFAGGRRGFTPTARQLWGSAGRTAHAVRSQAPVRSGTELPWLRRADSQTFEARSGRLMTRIYPFDVNYRTPRGSFARINTHLVRRRRGYAQKANNLGVMLPVSARGAGKVSVRSGALSFALSGASGRAQVSGRTERFIRGRPPLALEYASLSAGVAWQVSQPRSAASKGITWILHPTRGLSARLRRGAVVFVAHDGRVVWEFAAPSASIAGSHRALPTRLTLRRMRHGGLKLTVRITPAHRTHGRSRGKFASFSRALASSLFEPAALVNPSPIVWGGEVVSGTAVGLTSITGDCYIDSASPNTSFCLGNTNYVGPADHTLLNFDVTDNIPTHVQVIQAFAAMTLSSESTSTAENIGVWQAAQPWTNFATWNTYDGTNAWTAPGGDTTGGEQDYSTIGASGDVGNEFYWNINSIMQGWVDDNPTQNDGLYFAAEAGTSAPNTLGFYTETATFADIPYLEVYYEPRMGDYPSAEYATQNLTDRSTLGVSDATGDLLVSNNDLALAGVNGLNLDIGRYYNNLSTDQDSFGVGWSMGAGADSYIAVPCDDASTVSYFDGTGNAESFYVNQVTGQPVNPPGVDAQLTMSSGDSWSSGTFTLLFPHSGITETFTAPAYSCDKVAQLSTITNRDGDTITYHYTSGKLTSITDSYGNTTTITYTGGYVSQITDPTGRNYYYWQNSSGELTKYEDPAGNYTYYTYDAAGNLTEIQTPQGNIAKIHYDTASTNEVTSVVRYVHPTDTSGPKTTFQYAVASGTCPVSPGWMQATVKDPNGHVTTYCSDDLGRITVSRDANGDVRDACYASTGFPDAGVSPSGTLATTTYSTDGRNNVVALKDGGSSSMSCDGTGGGSGSGLSQTMTYGDTHNPYSPTAVVDPQGNTTAYSYDPTTGNTTSITTGSSVTSYTYDGTSGINYGTLATATDPDLATTTYTPSGGNIATVTPPSGSGLNPIHLYYDSANRVNEISSVSGGSGHEVDFTYDALDRKHTAVYKNASGTTVATITYTYDADGNLTQRTDSAGTTSYTYDGLDRLTQVTYPDGTWTKYGYDSAGNLTTLQDAGGTVTYRYDLTNQLTAITDPSASKPEATMTYDADGNMTRAAYASGASMGFAYNSVDQLAYQTDTYKTSSGTIAHLGWGSSSSNIQYTGDLMASVVDQAGNTTTYTYNALNQLTEAKTTNGSSTIADYQYTVDAAGNVARTILNGTTTSYAYRPGNETCWAYVGTSSNACGSPPTGAHIYAYDADGNETSNGNGVTETYNALGQTTSVTAGGTTTSYSYLGEGQDEMITEGATTLHNDMLGLASSTSGTTANYYTRDTLGTPLIERTATATYDYLYDDVGNVVGLLDHAGHLTNQYAYDPYGTKTTSTGAAPNPFGFQGGYQTMSGLYHFGARFYAPSSANWTQPDPANATSDASTYGFAADDPTNLSDSGGTHANCSWPYEQWGMHGCNLIPGLHIKIVNYHRNGSVIGGIAEVVSGSGAVIGGVLGTIGCYYGGPEVWLHCWGFTGSIAATGFLLAAHGVYNIFQAIT